MAEAVTAEVIAEEAAVTDAVTAEVTATVASVAEAVTAMVLVDATADDQHGSDPFDDAPKA